MSLPVSKRDKIVYLLDHWDDIHDPSVTSPGGSPGDGSGVPLLPLVTRSPSVRELVRCLAILKTEACSQHDHLMAYHTAEWRVHRWSEQKRRKGGKLETVNRHERQRITPSWVRLEKVRRAEERLCELFVGAVFIPRPFWDALTLSSAEIENRRRGRRGVAA